MNFFNKLIKNRWFIFILLLLDIFGFCFALYTYWPSILRYSYLDKVYLAPLFMISFWMFFLPAILLVYIFFKRKIPEFLGGLSFLYVFIYGFGSFLFYPLFMIFIRGLTAYHLWNVFAHLFIALQSFLFLKYVKKPRVNYIFILGVIFLVKFYLDLFQGTFLYFVDNPFPPWLKFTLLFIMLILLFLGLYLLSKFSQGKRLK